MNRNELERILPHREPMLLLDEAEQTEDGRARGRYAVRGDEFFLQGHYPDFPVVPGVILCEMMAQTCCVLLAKDAEKKTPFFAGLDKVRFKSMVRPGDTVVFECEIIKIKKPFYFASGKGSVNGKLSVSGEFSFALL